MSTKNLPPLEVGKAYVAADFEHFEYFWGGATRIRSHSSPSPEEWDHNDLPTSETRPAVSTCAAYTLCIDAHTVCGVD